MGTLVGNSVKISVHFANALFTNVRVCVCVCERERERDVCRFNRGGIGDIEMRAIYIFDFSIKFLMYFFLQ